MTNINQIFQTVDIEWTGVESNEVKQEIDLEFDFDPLAFALAAKRENLFKSDVHLLLSTATKDLSPEAINQRDAIYSNMKSDLDLSGKIQKYYKNKLLMRRLKGLHFTKFQEALEQVLDNPRKIKQSQIRILLKLDDFYQEDQSVDNLFKQYATIDGDPRTCEIDDEFVFVESIDRYTKKSKIKKYFFKNSKNNLLEIASDLGTNELRLMDYLVQQPSILIQGDVSITHHPHREDFLLYRHGTFRYYDSRSGK